MLISDWSSDVCSSDLKGVNVTQMHYARRGIITPEMEFVAIRENGKREWLMEYLADAEREARLQGHQLGAQIPRICTPAFVDRKRTCEGKRFAVRVDLRGRRVHKQNNTPK